MKKLLLITTSLLASLGVFFIVGVAKASPLVSMASYWQLNDGSGSSAAESSGWGAPATLVGSPTWDPGRFGNGLTFNGSNYASTTLAFPSTNGTVSMWVYPTAYNDWASPAGWKLLGGTNGYVLFDEGGGGSPGTWRAVFGPNNSGAGETDIVASSPIVQNAWTHLAMTWNKSGSTTTIAFYVNGTLQGTSTWVGTYGVGGFGNFHFGNSGDYPDNYFTGSVDDVRVYNWTLGQAQISDLAAGNQTAATWIGGSSNNYDTPANWDIGAYPDKFTRVTIGNGTYEPLLIQNEAFWDLNIQSSSTLDTAGFNLSLTTTTGFTSGGFLNHGTLILHGFETLSGFSNDTSNGAVMYAPTTTLNGLLFGGEYHDLIINDGLRGYWKMDDGTTGSQIADGSGYQLQATPYGSSGSQNGPQPSVSVPIVNYTDTGSYLFDGTDDYFDVKGGVPASIQGATPKTVAMWIYPTQASEGFVYLGGSDGGTDGQSLRFETDGSRHLVLDVSYGYEASTLQVTLNTWQFVAAEWDGANWKVCLNGTCQTLSTLPASDLQPGMFDIGRAIWDTQYMKGNLDDVRLYNRALSGTELSALAAGNEPSTSAVTVTNNHQPLQIRGGIYLNAGTFSNGNAAINVFGGIFDNNGGIFSPTIGGGVDIDVDNSNGHMNSSNTFESLSISGDPFGTPTFTFGAGSTLTADSLFMFSVGGGSRMFLKSSTVGRQWFMNVTGPLEVESLTVRDSDNLSPTIDSQHNDIVDSGNNTNWGFDTTRPTVPGIPTSTSPTNNNRPTITWTASTDSGWGLISPPYMLQWSSSSNFTSSLGVAYPSTNSYTLGTSLADGLWYFRVNATDVADNISAWATSTAPLIIATELPVVTLRGDAVMNVTQGNAFIDPGATATVSAEGEAYGFGVGAVTVSGSLDTNVLGTYTLTYSATDDVGNVGTATRTVTVTSRGGGFVPVMPVAAGSAHGEPLQMLVNGSLADLTVTSPVVALQFNGSSSVKGYAISLASDFAGSSILPYASNATYTLPAPGTYTLYVKFYSTTGQASDVVARKITYKGSTAATKPTVTTLPPAVATVFTRNLKRGMSGNDVKALQQFLNAHGFIVATTGPGSAGQETTTYGPATVLAVTKFQEAHADKILTPSGLTKGTGFFYAATRAVANGL